MSTISEILSHYIDPVTPLLTREIAETVVNRRPDPRIVARVAELGRKADEGTLTEEERDEYKNLVEAGDLISLLKANARKYLADHSG